MEFTDEIIRGKLAKGDRIEFSVPQVIKATWITELIRDRQTISTPIWIVNGVIEGNLRLLRITFEDDVVLIQCKINGGADFRFAHFKRAARFLGTAFGNPTTFSAAKADSDLELDAAVFLQGAVLSDLDIGQVFSAVETTFGSVDLARLKAGKLLDCRGARFSGRVTFENSQVFGNLDYRGAQFLSDADFHGISVSGSASFGPNEKAVPVRFAGTADFSIVTVGKSAYFQQTVFEQIALFRRSEIIHDALFIGAKFEKDAYFTAMRTGGDAVFVSARSEGAIIPVAFNADARFDSVHIDGKALFSGCRFLGDAWFQLSRIGEHVDFSAAVFRSRLDLGDSSIAFTARFAGTQFHGEASFGRMEIGRGLIFGESEGANEPARFLKSATFVECRLKGEVVFEGTIFEDAASFERIRAEQIVQFRPGGKGSVSFGGTANFCGAFFQSQAVFQNTYFKEDALFVDVGFSKEVLFEGAIFDGLAGFDRSVLGTTAQFCPSGHNPVRFRGGCRFNGARVNGDAVFTSVQFCGTAAFDGFRVEGNAFFRPEPEVGRPVRFGANAQFNNFTVLGAAEFMGVQFFGQAHFDSAWFKGQISFAAGRIGERELPVRFRRDAVFLSADFGSKAVFSGARFHSEAQFESARFRSDVHFENAVFYKKASFAGIDVSGFAFCRNAIFKEKAIFVGAKVASAHFGIEKERLQAIDAETRFHGPTDLRGFAYQRIVVNWKSVLESQEPFDREPYARLEGALRSKGEEQEANNVYFQCCKRENSRRRRRVLAALSRRPGSRKDLMATVGDALRCIYHGLRGLLFGYGVRPSRLFICSTILILAGGYVFSRPGAVVPRSAPPSAASSDHRLTYTEGLGLSARLFIPIVELPSGEAWRPSPNPFPGLGKIRFSYEGYGSIHRLFGAIFIPLLIAVIAGLFYRGGKR